MEALEGVLGRDLGVLGHQRVVAHVGHQQLVLEALGVAEAQPGVVALGLDLVLGQPAGPEVERVRARHAPDHAVDHAVAGAAGSGAGVLEEGEVEPGVGVLVAVEEVVDRRVVLVDRLLDQPQAEDSHIEVDVALGVAGDCRDVMDAVEIHCTCNYISAGAS